MEQGEKIVLRELSKDQLSVTKEMALIITLISLVSTIFKADRLIWRLSKYIIGYQYVSSKHAGEMLIVQFKNILVKNRFQPLKDSYIYFSKVIFSRRKPQLHLFYFILGVLFLHLHIVSNIKMVFKNRAMWLIQQSIHWGKTCLMKLQGHSDGRSNNLVQ